MSKIPEQIVNAAQDLVGRFGNKLAFIGKQEGNSVYQFRFPDDVNTGFPILFLLKDDKVTEVNGFDALDILDSFDENTK